MTSRKPNPATKAVNPSTKAKINIDPEIQSLIPALKPDELAKLRVSILEEGCRDPLVVWKDHGLLLDGHNRYAICKELDKSYSVREKEFPDKDHAMIWVLKNQLGRRNLSNTQFEIMVGKEYELQKKIARGGGDRKSGEANQRSQSGTIDRRPKRTRDRIAEEHGISPQTVARSADLHNSLESIREVAPEIATKLESEEIKASQKDIRTLGKVLKQGITEQKEKLVSDLNDDFKKAIETIKEIEAQSKQENPSPIKSNSDLDAFLMLADRMCCPKCGKKARLVLKWSCCGLSIDKSTNQPEDAKKNICLADSTDNRVEERMCDNEEHKDGKSYPESLILAEAIRANCADCMGNYADGQVSCETPKCSLFPFMPYNQANKQELI